MYSHWQQILLVASMAACTTTESPVGEQTPLVPGHLKEDARENRDPLADLGGQPCGYDYDFNGSQITRRYSYLYDPLGRVQTVIGVDSGGALYERTDQVWDHAGHVTSRRTTSPAEGTLVDTAWLYDTLGQRLGIQVESTDLDPADAHQISHSRTTITYKDFVGLDNPARSDQLVEDLDAHTSRWSAVTYAYDDFGRLVHQEGRNDLGEVIGAWTVTYDDDALRSLSLIEVAPTPDLPSGLRSRGTAQFDAAGHLLSDAYEDLGPGDVVTALRETVKTWDGDRLMSSVYSLLPPDRRWQVNFVTTYKYQCAEARRSTHR